MSKERTDLEIKNLKDMLNKTKDLYGKRPAFKLKDENGKYKEISHRVVREDIDKLGTALLTLGLNGKLLIFQLYVVLELLFHLTNHFQKTNLKELLKDLV